MVLRCSSVRSAVQPVPVEEGKLMEGEDPFIWNKTSKIVFAHCSLTVSLSQAPEKCGVRMSVRLSHTRAGLVLKSPACHSVLQCLCPAVRTFAVPWGMRVTS